MGQKQMQLNAWTTANSLVLDNSPLMFSEFTIAPESIFYRSSLCFAFVNLKPVLNGRQQHSSCTFAFSSSKTDFIADVLICPKRVCHHLTELTDSETADLFIVAKKVQRMLEKASLSCQMCVNRAILVFQMIHSLISVSVVPFNKQTV